MTHRTKKTTREKTLNKAARTVNVVVKKVPQPEPRTVNVVVKKAPQPAPEEACRIFPEIAMRSSDT